MRIEFLAACLALAAVSPTPAQMIILDSRQPSASERQAARSATDQVGDSIRAEHDVKQAQSQQTVKNWIGKVLAGTADIVGVYISMNCGFDRCDHKNTSASDINTGASGFNVSGGRTEASVMFTPQRTGEIRLSSYFDNGRTCIINLPIRLKNNVYVKYDKHCAATINYFHR